MNKPSTGRPTFKRNKVAGKNLCTALKILGKTWRKDVDNPKHVQNWINWTDYDLPNSPTTIDGDMRLGVPEQRITAYAMCLGVASEALCSGKTNMIKLLDASAVSPGRQILPMVPGHKDQFTKRYQEYNRPSYIKELFALMGGVYRMDYLLQGVEPIHRCTVWIYGAEASSLRLRGLFVMFGNENPFEACMFRWHNNLHTNYLCENGLELGYTMTVDPLRHNILRQRSPFWLRGTGMTDRGLADNQPITFTFRKQQIPCPEDMMPEAVWKRECQNIRKHPFIAPGEPDYERVRTAILTPEISTQNKMISSGD
jgi:hypothetical protein